MLFYNDCVENTLSKNESLEALSGVEHKYSTYTVFLEYIQHPLTKSVHCKNKCNFTSNLVAGELPLVLV